MKVGLLLEGGAMRGMYTAGVIDTLIENNIQIDGIVGVSAGALFGANYYSKQKGRVIRYSKKYCKDLRYISIPSLIFTGNVVNKKFAYYKITKKLDKFDNEEFIKNNKGYYAVTTNIETGKSEYLKINDVIKDMEILRATSALPLASKIIKIGNSKYLDGGISDPIPIDKIKSMGYDKIIVVLTQDKDYRKKPLDVKTIDKLHKKFKKYPKLVETMINRYKKYNDSLEKVAQMQKYNEIFVIRPSKKINIKIIERDENKLEEIYNIGINDSIKTMKELKKYLKETI